MSKIGVIGYGNFGSLLVELLKPDYEVIAFDDKKKVPTKHKSSMKDVGKSDYIILAVPVESYEAVLKRLKKHIAPGSVVIDISSVKQIPHKIVKKILPNHPYVATHPLFGPQTLAGGIKNKTIVFCSDISDKKPMQSVKKYCLKKGLNIVDIASKEHDNQMAYTQSVTFFIGRTLSEMNLLEKIQLKPPSFAAVERLIEMSGNHSWDLFYTMQNGNPLSEKVRKEVLDNLDKMHQKLNKVKKVV